MVFLNKNRGEKLKDGKKKLQKLVEKPSATAVTPAATATPAIPTTTATAAPTLQQPIQFSVKTSSIPPSKLPPALQLQPSAALAQKPMPTPTPSPMASAPWWVSDVTFIVEGKKIPGHKVVLQSRSEYFTGLFQGTTQDVTLEITDFSHHIFSQFVRWVYGGKKEITPEDAPELARCAHHFQAAELVSLCHKVLEEQHQASLMAAAAATAQQQQQQPMPTGLSASPSMEDEVNMQMDDVHNDPIIPHAPQNQGEMIEFVGAMTSDPYSGDFVSADEQSPDFGFGMNMWSSDPVLFPSSESADAFRIMEIC